MHQVYKPNVPIPNTNVQLISQMRLNLLEIGTKYLGGTNKGS